MNKRQLFRLTEIIIGSDLILPAVLLLVYGAFLLLIRGILPTSDELLTFFSVYYAKFGYEILFVAALLESLVILNLFAPGQVTLALGIVFARTGETQLPFVMVAVAGGIIVGYLIDYLIGYYGFGDILKRFGQVEAFEKAKMELKKNGGRSIFISFINPNIGSYISLAAGATKLEITMYLVIALFSIIFWVAAWSLLIYSLGDVVLMIIRKYAFVLSAIFIGILITSFAWNLRKK